MIGIKRIAAILASALVLAGCSRSNEATPVVLAETSIREAVLVANPKAAVNAIYGSLEEYKADNLDDERLETQVGINPADVGEYYGKLSDITEGLSDVIIIKPKENTRDDIQLALSRYKERRISEFENYDILDAYSIAQNAVIYPQGGYVIMLMLMDNDAAREIIDEYIPL